MRALRLSRKETRSSLLRLEMNYNPEKFNLSPALMEVLGIEVDTRTRIIAGNMSRQRSCTTRVIPPILLCDPPLKKVSSPWCHRRSGSTSLLDNQLIWSIGSGFQGMVQWAMLVMMCWLMLLFHCREKCQPSLLTQKYKEIEACDELIFTSI